MKLINKMTLQLLVNCLFLILTLSRCGTESSGGAILGQQPRPPGSKDSEQSLPARCWNPPSMEMPKWYYKNNCGPELDSKLIGSWNISFIDGKEQFLNDLTFSDSSVLSISFKKDRSCEMVVQSGVTIECYWSNDWTNKGLYLNTIDPQNPARSILMGPEYQFANSDNTEANLAGDYVLSKKD